MSAIWGAVLSGIMGYFGGEKEKTWSEDTTWNELHGIDTFLPTTGFEFLGGSSAPGADPLAIRRRRQLWEGGIMKDLEAAAEGLPPHVLQRILAGIATGSQGAGEESGRTAALGFGVSGLSPAQVEMSRAIAAANAGTQFEVQSQQVRADRMDAIRDFFGKMAALRTAMPSKTKTRHRGKKKTTGGDSGGGMSGFASGFMQGMGGF